MVVAIEYSVYSKKIVKCTVIIGKIDMNLSRLRDVMFNVAELPYSFHFEVRFSLIADIDLYNVRFVPEANIADVMVR